MSPFRRSAIGLGVSRETIACAARVGHNQQWRVSSTQLPTGICQQISQQQIEIALDDVLAQFDELRARECRIVLASECLYEWVMEVPAGVKSLRELQALAGARFSQLHAQPAEDWIVRADWTARGPMLCTAAPRTIVQLLQNEFTRRDLRVSITTTLCAALDDLQQFPSDAWLCIQTAEYSIIMLIVKHSLQLLRAVRTLNLDPGELIASMVAELKRACLRGDLPSPSQLHLYDCTRDHVTAISVDGVEIIPLRSSALSQVESAYRHSDATIAACLGAA